LVHQHLKGKTDKLNQKIMLLRKKNSTSDVCKVVDEIDRNVIQEGVVQGDNVRIKGIFANESVGLQIPYKKLREGERIGI